MWFFSYSYPCLYLRHALFSLPFWTVGVVTTVGIFLPTHSVILSFLCVFQFTDFVSVYGPYLHASCSSVILDWVPDAVNYTLLSAGWTDVCLELHRHPWALVGTQSHCLETAWSFLALLWCFGQWHQGGFVPLLRQLPSKCSVQFFLSGRLGTGTVLGLPWGLFSPVLLDGSFPILRLFLLRMGWTLLLLGPGGETTDIRSPLCMAFSLSPLSWEH